MRIKNILLLLLLLILLLVLLLQAELLMILPDVSMWIPVMDLTTLVGRQLDIKWRGYGMYDVHSDCSLVAFEP